MTALDTGQLAELFAHWLPGQRWFAGKSRPIDTIRARTLGTIGAPPAQVHIWLADVTYLDGVHETYQVPLRINGDFDEALDHARVGQLSDADGQTVYIYDAMWDKRHTQEWVRALGGVDDSSTADSGDEPASGEGVTDADPGDQGSVDRSTTTPIQFHLTADAVTIPAGTSGRVLTGEQSNTSVVFGEQAILKVFRRLEIGINPDIEIHEALGRVNGRHIARLLGYITADFSAGQGSFEQVASAAQDEQVSLAMLQELMTGATDGWELAKASVRDLMAEADLHASEAGGDFAGEAFRLGIATAEVHADLVSALGQQVLTVTDMRDRADAMIARLDSTMVLVPELAPVADALRGYYEQFAAGPPMTVQRVHGDLHLGQVLRTARGWTVLDFEGEPVKSIASRRESDSPLRDVAGMLRSFDYAGYHQIVDSASTNQSNYRAAEWADRNREAFRTGYAHVTAGDDPVDTTVLLRAFEADKAVYEAAYEARNRPAWLAVPLASLGRLVAPTSFQAGDDPR